MDTTSPRDPDSIDCPACEGQGQSLVGGVYRTCESCGGSCIDREALAAYDYTGPTLRLNF